MPPTDILHPRGKDLTVLGERFGVADLKDLIRRYLYFKASPDADPSNTRLHLSDCPEFEDIPLKVHYSASSTFHAPSDPPGMNGLRREYIRAPPSWRGGASRFDIVFVNKNNGLQGLLGLEVARVRLFFSFRNRDEDHACAAVHWYGRTDDEPDDDTGMWVVKPLYHRRRRGLGNLPLCSVISLDTIVRAAHLVGVVLDQEVSPTLRSEDSLDTFKEFFVNKYIDHHAFELLNV